MPPTFILSAFLSTLSLRRATRLWTILYSCPGNFYPRSPCGERLINTYHRIFGGGISIHALLAESDARRPGQNCQRIDFYPRSPCGERQLIAYQSGRLRDFYPRSPCGERRVFNLFANPGSTISIHALLAESDHNRGVNLFRFKHFYPRSPCGERPVGVTSVILII